MSNQNLKYTLSLQDLFTNKMSSAINKTKTLDKGVGRLKSKISEVGKSLAAIGAGVAIVGFGKSIIESLKNYEYFSASLRTLMKGDILSANALEKQLISLATKTPFSLVELQDATKQLLAYGFTANKVTKNIAMLGDVASSLKIPFNDIAYLYGTLKTQGRAFSKDIYQFTGRGIPIVKELAKQFRVTDSEVMKLVEDGKVGFKDIEKAFKSMTSEGGMFFNMMSVQSKTVGGQLSNMGDQWEQLKVNIGKSQTGIINSTVSMVNSLVASLNNYFIHINTEADNFSKHGAIAFSWWEKALGVFNSAITGNMMDTPVKEQADFQNSLSKTYGGIKDLSTGYNQLISLNNLLMNQKVALNNKEIDIAEYSRRSATIKGQIETVQSEISLIKNDGINKNAATISDMAPNNAGTSADGTGAAGKAGLGSGTEVSGSRPQNLTINIDKLIETFEIKTNNMAEGAGKIKEMVTKALLESVNDLNMITR